VRQLVGAVKLFGYTLFERKGASLDDLLNRMEAAMNTASGVVVTPENCEESPTVQAIVNAISMQISTLPVHVYMKTTSGGREKKERLQSHPVEKLLSNPNAWQTSSAYWLDAASCMVRYGRFVAVKGRGVTGPIRYLKPIVPSNVQLEQDESMNVVARVTTGSGQREYPLSQMHYVRARSKDFLNGESPVNTAREAIALEIAAQRYGSAFFGNGAMPGLVFQFMDGVKGFTSKDQRDDFVNSFQRVYGSTGRFKAMLLPPGIAKPEAVGIENDKAQFLETRKMQRNVIAGAFGVPPHLVGDLERGTFSNIEHQSQEFVGKVILPYVQMFEDAMERDLLTSEDRRMGVIVRFNVDAGLRADFKSRQEGLRIQREAGVINPNEWREREGMNPRPNGEDYWEQGPSGQTAETSPENGAPDDDTAQ
jgi:HK97 family phage portal protein